MNIFSGFILVAQVVELVAFRKLFQPSEKSRQATSLGLERILVLMPPRRNVGPLRATVQRPSR
jgi:hypothetical protein